MSRSTLLIGVYQGARSVDAVLERVRRHRGVRLAAACTGGGPRPARTRIVTSWLRGPCIAGLVAGLAFGFGEQRLTGASSLLAAGLVASGGLAGLGVAAAYIWVHARWRGNRLLSVYHKRLLRGEACILVDAAAPHAPGLLGVLSDTAGASPATFVVLPSSPAGTDRDMSRLLREPLTPERLSIEASQLAHTPCTPALASAGPIARTLHYLRAAPLLKRLRTSEFVLDRAYTLLQDAARLELRFSPGGEWLLDNAYLILGHVDEFKHNLPRRYYYELPVVADGPFEGFPRIYALAAELVADTDALLNAETIQRFLQAYQTDTQLQMGELWAIPTMLRLRLIEALAALAVQVEQRQRESEIASFWSHRLLHASREDPDKLLPLLADLSAEHPEPSGHLATQLLGNLYDEDASLGPVSTWLVRKLGLPAADITSRDHRREAAEQTSLANAITSLRLLAQMDWRAVFESVNLVDSLLWSDPTGIYPKMDFATRDEYRHVIESVARRSNTPEMEVARRTLDLANAGTDDLTRHVGFYLLDDGVSLLQNATGASPPIGNRLLRAARRRPSLVYCGGTAIITAIIVTALIAAAMECDMSAVAAAILAPALLIPTSEIAVQVMNFLITGLVAPRLLPKLSFEDGIPPDAATLVVVPMMLLTPPAIADEVERLAVRYLANPDPELRYALLSDHSDAPQREMPEDFELLDIAARGIEDLDRRYGPGRFFLFHRERTWSAGEQRWMGLERKRGKLEELNRYLLDPAPFASFLHVGDASRLTGIRYVITLDADTQLPRDTARRMVETIAHPLNRAVLTEDARAVRRGYTIIQPRVTTGMPSATSTFFTRLFSDQAGVDPYTRAVSNVYQDLAGASSYHGKGIYDVAAFHKVLGGRLPEAQILSHDLLEGAHVRVGFASDIELFDLFPKTYRSYSLREHRWVRGDWQIIDWIRAHVREQSGTARSTLTGMDRWKIADNLRRSLLPVFAILLLLLGWLISPVPDFWSLTVGIMLLVPLLQQLATAVARTPAFRSAIWRELLVGFVRSVFLAAILPMSAATNLDAIVRVFYRRLVSHKYLLEWQPYGGRRLLLGSSAGLLAAEQAAAALICSVASVAIMIGHPGAILPATPFAALWLVGPSAVALLSNTRWRRRTRALSGSDRRFLRRGARATWQFFDDMVTAEMHWLPPDNYQEALVNEVAKRTSPTNIGLYLLSILAAYDLGYITMDAVLERVGATLDTVSRLEQFEGHLLNWYDTRTLEPLARYVSTVDSGNLLGALWTLRQGLSDLPNEPIVGASMFAGLADTLYVLERSQGHVAATVRDEMAVLRRLCTDPPGRLDALLNRLHAVSTSTRLVVESFRALGSAPEEATDWVNHLEAQVTALESLEHDYLDWANVLIKPPPEGILSLGRRAHELRRSAIARAPSLASLAGGEHPGVAGLLAARQAAGPVPMPDGVASWLEQLESTFRMAQERAAEQMRHCHGLAAHADAQGSAMNLAFLYDSTRRLFCVGYDVNERRPDKSHYDLLASEARLCSFLAIARGEAPLEHWWALGRPFGASYRRRPLLSWSGTLFEYLLPLLVTRSVDESLLDYACRTAVAVQIAYGRQRGIPWGISEAAFSALDARQVYQYRAFGVPSLGLKRGLEDDLVVAPYASALALAVDPRSATENLRALARARATGVTGKYGYYEALDFTRQHGPQGERGEIVKCFMAHHQAMTLLAIDNALHNGVMQRRFHADPRVKASESLLYERIPHGMLTVRNYATEAPLARLPRYVPQPLAGRIDTPDTPAPKVVLLGNDTYSVMVTAAGGGYSRWRDVEVTRWRADTARDAWGSFIYLRDTGSNETWSASSQPMGSTPGRYSVHLGMDKADFKRRDGAFDTAMEVAVSPEDDVEIRRVTVNNRSLRARELEVTSYVELALAPHAADRSHPAFSKMFIETEALPDLDALLAYRRPREPDEQAVYAVHLVATPGLPEEPAEVETDRAQFIGRGRTVADPAGLGAPLSGAVGATLDPVFCMRRRIRVDAGERAEIVFITGAAATRDEAVALAEKYHAMPAADRAIRMAWSHAQVELRHLRIHMDDALRAQELASHILYPHADLRAPADRIRANSLGQPGLWAQGISGDLPIVVVNIGEADDLTLVREALIAHSFWRRRGLSVDLVILDQEPEAYEQPVRNELRRLVQPYPTDTRGGIFLRSGAQIPEVEQTLLLSAARAVLVGARGSLAQQLSAWGAPHHEKKLEFVAPPAEQPSPPLQFLELPYFNGLGGFTADGSEYAIYLQDGQNTPAPWSNVMANPTFGTLVTEAGSGFTWNVNSQSNRLTPWSNDPVADPPGDVVYLRDDDSGYVWTPTPLPMRESDPYRARHGQGYTVFEHNSHGLIQELTVFVPVDGDGGAPVRVQILRLRNASTVTRRLTVTAYAEWVLGTDREDSQPWIVTSWDAASNALFARNSYRAEFSRNCAFLYLDGEVTSYTGDRVEFLGRNGSVTRPAGLSHHRLSGRTGAALDPCGAISRRVELASGQEASIVVLLGEAPDAGQAQELIRKLGRPASAVAALAATRAWWNRHCGALTVETPDNGLNYLMNRWLPYQVLSCRLWGRSAFYQSGGAFGFRDQLQDAMAVVYAEPSLVRAQILRSAARQFAEGDVQHWWHEPSGVGVRTRISDDMLWLPFVVAHYVRVTGDADILKETVPYLDGPILKPAEHDAYFTPTESAVKESLLDHCKRAIAHSATQGKHGLPLIGAGDWNDGLNRVGVGGAGESVWLAWFRVAVLKDCADLLEVTGDAALAAKYRTDAETLAHAVEATSWDGAWYRRAYYDDGTALGSATAAECQIDSISQAWSVLSGGGEPARQEQALQSVMERLVLKDDNLVLLLAPPFESGTPDPGYIRGYPPGVRENGGQYTHGSLWTPVAFARRGQPDTAVDLLNMMSPVAHALDESAVARYRVEPYVTAGDVYGPPSHAGRGGWTWYSGSAAWMYRAWLEEILGFKPSGASLTVAPRLPSSWPGYKAMYRYGTTTYDIVVERDDAHEPCVKLDGECVQDDNVPLRDDGVRHTIHIVTGSEAG